MSFVVSSLTNYTNEQSTNLLSAALFGGKTAKLMYEAGQVQVGIKNAETLNILSSSVYFQSDACGLTPSGLTTFTQRTITVAAIGVEETLCPKSLEKKWMGVQMAPGSAEALPFEEQIGLEKANVIANQLEIAMWQGTVATSNTNPNTNKFDGFTTILTALGFGGAGDPVSGNTISATAITTSNIDDILDAIYAAIPSAIASKENLVCFCGIDTYKKYLVNLKNANLYHYMPEAGAMEMIVPGTNMKLIAVGGLDGTNKLVATHLTNLFVGTDLANEEEQYKFVFDPISENVYFKAKMKYGVQIAFPDEVVYFTL